MKLRTITLMRISIRLKDLPYHYTSYKITMMFIPQRRQRVSSLIKMIGEYKYATLNTEVITFATLLISFVESLSCTAAFQTIVYDFLSTAMP